jgi:hypothetical protein
MKFSLSVFEQNCFTASYLTSAVVSQVGIRISLYGGGKYKIWMRVNWKN